MSEAIGVKAFAAEAGIPSPTLYWAIKAGHLDRLPGVPAQLDRAEAEAWARGWHERAAREQAGSASRQRRLNALAVGYTAEIATLRRKAAELRRETAPREALDAARDRATARLQAAVASLPTLQAAQAAEALGQPGEAVRTILQRFARRLGGGGGA